MHQILWDENESARTQLRGAVKFIDKLVSGYTERALVDTAHTALGMNQPEDPTPQSEGTEYMESDGL